ncbi:MAG: citramalate synthase [Planctomycetes bacterium]|nr:citramalate synthase [Planctomycetota bacterium]
MRRAAVLDNVTDLAAPARSFAVSCRHTERVTVLDTTLRDGAQGANVSFSVADKLHVARVLDRFGVSYIEAGTPASNPKDEEFFRAARALKLGKAKLCAFGSTRRKDVAPAADPGLRALLAAATPVVSIFGKAWDWHVTEILRTSLAENLRMIGDSVRYLRRHGKEVLFDAEHFFDGYAANPDYAFAVVAAAAEAGAACVCLCDTNGGALPTPVFNAVRAAVEKFPGVRFGIHTHNDSGCAVANALVALEAGVTLVQGTFTGVGERCGNADLAAIVAGASLKKRRDCDGDLSQLCATAAEIAEIANLMIPGNAPYIGQDAFAHKAGMHVDGVLKSPATFEHVAPEAVGNHRRFLVSEIAGRRQVMEKIKALAPGLRKDAPELRAILARLKELESYGYQYEAADASFELMVRKIIGKYRKRFTLVFYKTIGEFPHPGDEMPASAIVKVEVGGKTEMAAASGNGPVNALDGAFRKALSAFYPEIAAVRLTDYKVRVLEENAATAAKVRVLIEHADGVRTWNTVGVSSDIIEASMTALTDAVEYKLALDGI